MDTQSVEYLNAIYQLSDEITESRARMLSIMYEQQKSGLTTDKTRSNRIENLQVDINKLTLTRRDKIMRYYSRTNLIIETSQLSTPISHHQQQSISPDIQEQLPRPDDLFQSSIAISRDTDPENRSNRQPEEENKWSTEPVPIEEKAYYEKCRQYYNITQMPLISVSENIFYDHIELTSASLACIIDDDANNFDVKTFLNNICDILKIDDISISKIQKGCIKVVFEIFKNVVGIAKTIQVRALYDSITDKVCQALGKLKILFMFMGDVKTLGAMHKFRNDIILHPTWNRIYDINHLHWNGSLQDGRDRGIHPYFCPSGWQRYSFYVTDQFYQKFKGWSVCYHGTKFTSGLSILLSGLKPATRAQHDVGIYASPSIIYTSHPRYSEVKKIESIYEKEFFKNGQYVQFVLQCRVHPRDIKTYRETLNASSVTIDPNVNNDSIEWVIDTKGKPLMDFNDPNSTIVCTGLMVRVTDSHPGLLPEAQWWYQSHLCNNSQCCLPGINCEDLRRQKQNGGTCNVIFN